ncbi:MAG: DNA gyrase C-terminal beta-propeller domain-containing protein, partial [Pseudomonadota bacterium]
IAYLNIDEVIRIIRFEEEPKQKLIARFELTDVQAEAILNMRLRSLAKLQEIEIRKEHEKLSEEKAQIENLLGSEESQWAVLKHDIGEVKKQFGKDTELGRRRTSFGEAKEIDLETVQQAMIEKEPVTVVLSQKGWIRAVKGHASDMGSFSFKEGDSLLTAFHAETTDKVILFNTGGKFFTIGVDKLPGGRGHGEPVRVMVDMENDSDIIAAFKHDSARKLLVTSRIGNGFVVPESEVVANTRKGKQVLNVKLPDEAAICIPADGDHLAVVGDNRKLLVFTLEQVPEMTRGKGVRLQKYKDASVENGLRDALVFKNEEGLAWEDSAGRKHTRTMEDLSEYLGDRAQAGRVAPKGFPKNGRFNG